jgi:hypothetical protein
LTTSTSGQGARVSRARRSPAKQSFDLFSNRDTSIVPGVSVGYALFHLDPVWIVPELGYSGTSESASGLLDGAIARTSLGSKNAYAGVSARWELLSILDVAARISGGVSFLNIQMTPNGPDAAELHDDTASPFMTLGGGFTVHTPMGLLQTKTGALRSLIAGVSFEGGYIFGGSVDLTPARSDSDRIKTSYLSLGSLDRSGPYLKASLTARF